MWGLETVKDESRKAIYSAMSEWDAEELNFDQAGDEPLNDSEEENEGRLWCAMLFKKECRRGWEKPLCSLQRVHLLSFPFLASRGWQQVLAPCHLPPPSKLEVHHFLSLSDLCFRCHSSSDSDLLPPSYEDLVMTVGSPLDNLGKSPQFRIPNHIFKVPFAI